MPPEIESPIPANAITKNMSAAPKPRPKYYELNLAHHWPPAVLSIFHRISGALLFFPILPLLLWMLQSSLAGEEGYARWQHVFANPVAKLALVAASWAYAHHFFAGLRYLVLDLHVWSGKPAARASALAVFVLGALAALAVAVCVW
jgi:succinate dehydrogenase / fumarate reductase cytochrome b subunit